MRLTSYLTEKSKRKNSAHPLTANRLYCVSMSKNSYPNGKRETPLNAHRSSAHPLIVSDAKV